MITLAFWPRGHRQRWAWANEIGEVFRLRGDVPEIDCLSRDRERKADDGDGAILIHNDERRDDFVNSIAYTVWPRCNESIRIYFIIRDIGAPTWVWKNLPNLIAISIEFWREFVMPVFVLSRPSTIACVCWLHSRCLPQTEWVSFHSNQTDAGSQNVE